MKGKRIGEYQITNQLLGSGSFSQVYLGYSHLWGKVAVKIIPRDNIKGKSRPISDNQIELFEREINLLNHCKNQFIVDLIDVKKTKSNFYIFLEYCHEGNLQELISRQHKLPEKDAMHLFSQILKAMNTMKKAHVVHRDLKPANIMLKGNDIKIVDFGLATKYSKG